MLTRIAATAAVFFAFVSAASACDADVRGDYNSVTLNCTEVQRDAGAALVDGIFSALNVYKSRNAYRPRQPRAVLINGWCPTYGGYVSCQYWVQQ